MFSIITGKITITMEPERKPPNIWSEYVKKNEAKSEKKSTS